MLTNATDIVGRANQVFIVGQGLSNAGVEMLGKKLANMTIGDIQAMLDMKNLDPVVVVKLLGQLKDLAKALVSNEYITVVKSDDENNFILQSLNLLYKYCIQLKFCFIHLCK